MRKILPICLVILIFACAGNFNQRSYQAFGTMAITYNVVMETSVDMHKRGLISEEGKQQIIKAATEYRNAHNKAVDAFQEYVKQPSETTEQKARAAMDLVLKLYSTMLDILSGYGVYGEPVEPWF